MSVTPQEVAALPQLARAGTSLTSRSQSDEKHSESSKGNEDTKENDEHGTGEQVSPWDGSQYDVNAVGHPRRIAIPAVIAVLFFSLGSNFFNSSISPLKSILKKEMDIDNAQYATLDTADSLINTVVPIVCGILVDWYGPFAGAIASSIFILIGAVMSSIAASKNAYHLFLAGQIVFGLGSSYIEIVQNTLYSWFAVGGGIIGLVYGSDIAVGRIWNLAGKLSAVPIEEQLDNYAWTFWIGTILCAFTLVIVLALYFYSFTFPDSSRYPTGRQRALTQAAAVSGQTGDALRVSFASSWKIERKHFVASLVTIPACFWIMDITQLLQGGCVGSYTSNLADAIKVTRNASTAAAGYTAAIGQVIPIVLIPHWDSFSIAGGTGTMAWVTWTAALWIVVFSLLAYTQVNALAVSILGSLALATNVLPWIASIPLLVPRQSSLGTAFGIYKALQNCGTVIMTVSSGAIQDRAVDDANQYRYVFAFLIAIKALDVIYGLGYWAWDLKYLHGILAANDKELCRKEAEIPHEVLHGGIRAPIGFVSFIGLGTVCAAIVTAWVLYWVYSV